MLTWLCDAYCRRWEGQFWSIFWSSLHDVIYPFVLVIVTNQNVHGCRGFPCIQAVGGPQPAPTFFKTWYHWRKPFCCSSLGVFQLWYVCQKVSMIQLGFCKLAWCLWIGHFLQCSLVKFDTTRKEPTPTIFWQEDMQQNIGVNVRKSVSTRPAFSFCDWPKGRWFLASQSHSIFWFQCALAVWKSE